ncbi:uncharacterized protein PG998_002058 [Apiospora kogelbergensis]|uniref:DUF8035 domain-containing protein n=1 Tax=Apiospora kogelbergensis TaxID=1337665 RepID=A0AAW0QFA0_9PEZI
MSRYSRYSDDESDYEVHISRERHTGRSPAPPVRTAPVHYVQAGAPRRPFYEDHDRFLVPAQERTVVTTRSRSRDRRSRRDSSPLSSPPRQRAQPQQAQPQQAGPVIINNRIYNHSDDSDSESYASSSPPRRLQVAHHRHRSHSRGDSSSYYREQHEREHERERGERQGRDDARREYERELERSRREFDLEQAQRELQELKLKEKIDADERRVHKSLKEEEELRSAKRELDEIRRARQREEDERRIKQKLDLQRLQQEEKDLAEKKRRDKEAKDAIERYKKEEAERTLREKEEAERRDREVKAKMQEQLLKSGLGEKEISAILAGKKIEKEKKGNEKGKNEEHQMQPYPHQPYPPQHQHQHEHERPTYTKMARRHLSLETLRVYGMDYVLDQDPEYVLIKRWVTEPEQDMLWRHTKIIREERSGKLIMTIKDKEHRHKHLEPEFEWVRKKERRRSKSPSLLMYLAGAKPA